MGQMLAWKEEKNTGLKGQASKWKCVSIEGQIDYRETELINFIQDSELYSDNI